MKHFLLILLSTGSFLSFSQNSGFFGKKNMLSVHGSAFLRGIPQAFFPSTRAIYTYKEGQADFKWKKINPIWNIGGTYRHITGRSSAFGVRYDYAVRAISSPYAENNSSFNDTPFELPPHFLPVYGIPIFEPLLFGPEDFYSDAKGQFIPRLNNAFSTAAFVRVHSFSFVYSRNKTLTFMPLGLVSTFGLGVQSMSMLADRDAYLKYTYRNDYFSPDIQTIERITPPPTNFENKYWGLMASWDLSINYPISKNIILEFASELRSTFLVAWRSDIATQSAYFPLNPDFEYGHKPLASTFYGRNMKNELRREMIFNNTFRLGLTFIF
jgi:hypothetical protein